MSKTERKFRPYPFIIVWCICFSTTLKGQDSLKAFSLSGYTEVYYAFNFNKPISNTQPHFLYSFNRCNEANLNIGLIKASYNVQKVRANLAFMTGTYPMANLASEPEVLRNIFEANIGVKLSTSKNLWLDAGIMPSHIGFEGAIGKECYNLSRSLMAENSPYYETGIKVGYTTRNEKWYVAALLLNGWQKIKRTDGNSTPAFGTQVTFKPSTKMTINSSTFIGSDSPDSARLWRYFHNFYGTFLLGKKWSTTIGLDYGLQQKTTGSNEMNTWHSPILILRCSISNKVTLAGRVEYYYDRNGIIIPTNTSNGFKTTGYSFNFDYAIQPNVLWRIEARTLQSKDPIFNKQQNQTARNCTWLTTALSVGF